MQRKKQCILLINFILIVLFGCGCSFQKNATVFEVQTDISEELVYQADLEIEYAEGFVISAYEDGYYLITVQDGNAYLVIPEGKEKPSDLADDIICIYQPLQSTYIAGSATMDMIVAIDRLSAVSFVSLESSDWEIEEVQEAMELGMISYVGKYSAPDYEQLLNKNTNFVVENTMILHAPEIKEAIENMGIPVFIDYATYESHPLGRTEWVKVYGVLYGCLDAAEDAFEEQKELYLSVSENEKTEYTVAFFYVATDGTVVVRKSEDYIAKMIEAAGGTYIFEDLGSDNQLSTEKMQMEEFYATAKDVDFLIYNGTITGSITSIQDLIDKDALFADFKAVKEKRVYSTTANVFQRSMAAGTLTKDIYYMLQSETDKMEYLYYVED